MINVAEEKERISALLSSSIEDYKFVSNIESLIGSGEYECARTLLHRHRAALLDELHKSQRNLDSFDFLIYQIDKLQKAICADKP